MTRRLHAHKKKTRIETPDFSTAPAMFQPRPFVVQSQTAQKSQQPDIKTSLRQAERYGHHLSRMQPTGVSAATATQPKLRMGQPMSSKRGQAPQVLQAKLTVGAPGDKYEQEADAVAARVVDQINGGVKSTYGQEGTQEQTQNHPVQHPKKKSPQPSGLNIHSLAQRASSENTPVTTPGIEQSIEHERGNGQALSDNVRKPMEQAFGTDFSGVKVHTDTQSDQLNQSVHAKAFTTGQDVFFRQSTYNPQSKQGQHLLAHELTHVVQQSGK